MSIYERHNQLIKDNENFKKYMERQIIQQG